MSYCVNCGVELAPSQESCPLCGVVVNNPIQPWEEPTQRPYPRHVEMLISRVDRRFGAWLATLLLALPVTLTFIMDLLVNERITWSAYVIAAGVWLYTVVIFPMHSRKQRIYLFEALDTAATLFFVLAIAYATDISWYLPLGLPIGLLCGGAALGITFIIRRRKMPGLYRTAIVVVLLALFTVGVDLVSTGYATGVYAMRWSLYTAVPLVFVAVVFLVLERRQKLKERILRKLFI